MEILAPVAISAGEISAINWIVKNGVFRDGNGVIIIGDTCSFQWEK